MNKKFLLYFLLGATAPLHIFAQDTLMLQTINIKDDRDIQQEYKEENFYKTYSSELITKKEIQEESSTSITDVISNVSNVRVVDRGGFSKSIKIRGLSGERVVSVVDGTKMSNHGMTMGGGGELSLINVSSVEQVEVVKGSPSIVYDPGATGGVVKVTTIKNPRDLKDYVKADYMYNYDDGYILQKHTASTEVKYKDFFASIGGSYAKSEGRRVKDQQKQDDIFSGMDRDLGNENGVSGFGYTTNSLDAQLNYQFHDKANVYYKAYFSDSDNITQVVGSTIPTVIQYLEYNRVGDTIGLNLRNIVGFNKIDIIHSNQELFKSTRGASDSIDEVTLLSNTTKVSAESTQGDFLILAGLEHTVDDAETLTLSNQSYNAIYLSTEYIQETFTLSAGVRYNKYHVTQELKPGQNPDVAGALAGVSGIIDKPIDDDAVNYSAGILYNINEHNNIAFNYAKTYRYPSLYERFAFGGGFIGGGEEMQAEEANNYEISFKHLSKEWSVNFSIFKSDFDTYNSFRMHQTGFTANYENNATALRECRDDPDCNPYLFVFKYETFQDVQNEGFELDIEKKFIPQALTVNFLASLSHLSDGVWRDEHSVEDYVVRFAQDPLEFGLNIKKEFKYALKPWIKLKLRYVTDIPEVEQYDQNADIDFDPFSVADLYFGAKTDMFSFNGGIRNLTDAVYHEPYSPLDGVERTVFFNVGIKLEKLLLK